MASIKREAQTVDFGQAASSRGPRDTTGYVNPDVDAERGSLGVLSTASQVRSSSLDTFVGQLGQAMQVYGNKQMRQEGERQYLEGAAAAMAGKSQEQVETNIFTRAWKNEGFADTRGRLGIADAEAQLATDMVKLREQDPTKMKEYLTTRREGLLGLMEGMSMEARKGMMGQMAMSDQHALVKHQGEYSKFVIDQQATAITTAHSVLNSNMNAAKGNPAAYEAATRSAMAGIWSNVVQNPNLPKANKQQLIEDAALLSLENNNELLYERMRDTKDDAGVALLDTLPAASQRKLAKAYQESQRETATMRNGEYNTQLGLYQGRLNDKNAEGVPWEDHVAFVQRGVQLKIISGEKQASLAQQWAQSQSERSMEHGAAAAVASGDRMGLAAMGVSPSKAFESYIRINAKKGKSEGDIITGLVHIGIGTGQYEAFTEVSKMLKPAINSITLTPGGKMDPGALSGLNAVLGSMSQLDEAGQKGARVALLAGLDDETGSKLLTYMDAIKRTGNPAAAAVEAATTIAETSNLSKAQKDALGALRSKEIAAVVASMEPKDFLERVREKVTPDFLKSKGALALETVRPHKGFWESEERAARAAVPGKMAMMEELDTVARMDPHLSIESLQIKAARNVALRTVEGENGKLYLPQGQTIQSFFGARESQTNDVVGRVLDKFHRPLDPDNRVVYSVTSTNRLAWVELNKAGDRVGQGDVDPKSIRTLIDAEQNERTKKYMETDGAGVRFKGHDGSEVQYNGENTIGIGTNVMLQYRKDLVQFEQVRSKPYDDASGKIVDGKRVQTVGVGVSSHNPNYPKVQPDGTVSTADISKSFMDASDAAMKSANASMQGLPAEQRNAYTTRLFGQLAYQGGSVPNGRWKDSEGKSHYNPDRDLLKFMAAGDREGALKALQASTQYRMAHKERKNFYDAMFSGAMFNGTMTRHNF